MDNTTRRAALGALGLASARVRDGNMLTRASGTPQGVQAVYDAAGGNHIVGILVDARLKGFTWTTPRA